jgi:hypothetical protein
MRAELAGRLEGRRAEIEAAVLTRIHAISDPAETEDPEYTEGLRAALTAALDYGLAAIECGAERTPSPPPVLLVQARMAARAGVSLDTVLRRYFAGYSLLGDFLVEEVENENPGGSDDLQRLLRTQAILFDRLLAAVSEEYDREVVGRPDSAEKRRSVRIVRLLAGELIDTTELAYEFDAHHLGVIAAGPTVAEAVHGLAAALDSRLLIVSCNEETIWAWFGGRCRIDREELDRIISATWPVHAPLAIGEFGQGLTGWRLTHQQAKAAMSVARRSAYSHVHYADVAVVASMLRDDLLITSLRELYLDPLARERDGGEALRTTLRAYFTAERNTTSAAIALGVSRQTVISRLRMIEERLGCQIGRSAIGIETALHLDALGAASLSNASLSFGQLAEF